MLLKAVLVILVCGFSSAFMKKAVNVENLSSLSHGDGTDHHESLVSEPVTDVVGLLRSQLNNHERLLHDAYNLIHQQSRQLSQQESVLQQQAEILNKQEKLLQRLLSSEHYPQVHENTNHLELKGKYTQEDTSSEGNREVIHTNMKNPGPSSPHLRQTRADDNGPLQVIIDHMSQQISTMDAEIQALKTSYHQIENVQASTFVHWGSSTCSDISELVYAGVVGGSYYSYSGGGSNYLCLTMHPVPSNHSLPTSAAYLYGSEFYTYDNHVNKDPVCAVCRSKFSTTIMIPGTNVCSPGWHLDYEGFLMAGAYNQAGSTQYTCVDSKMESRVGGDATQYGMAMYYTVTQCGSLPCEPYQKGKVVTCAVCSK